MNRALISSFFVKEDEIMNYSVIVLCAGIGQRTGLDYNKVFYKFQDQTIYEMTLSHFVNDERCKQIIVVCREDEKEEFRKLYVNYKIEYVIGGRERQDSVYNGLKKVNQEYVFIHDGARPFIKKEHIDNLLESVVNNKACLLMVSCTDTIKEVKDGKVVKTLKRENLMQAQTPQVFLTSLVKEAYQKGIENQFQATDDAQMVEMFSNQEISIVIGDYDNKKVTTREDLK